MEILKNNKVLLGLSGGVDSTAAVLILREKGYDVTGYYFDVLGNNKDGQEHARKVADQLGIKLIVDDVNKDFSQKVIGNFCSEYAKGRTPNPCIVCNPNIKFKKLIETANREGCYHVATGHYANVVEEEGVFYLAQGENKRKDQSYMMYRLGQNVLSRLILPLGSYDDKSKVRDKARANNMVNAETPDSQEICFIDDNTNHLDYMVERGYVSKPGNFIDKEGNILGKHKGVAAYTIGQRKGLGISLGKPAFVTKIDYKNNTVTLGDNQDLFNREVYSRENVFADANIDLSTPMEVKAKIRYASIPADATIEKVGEDLVKTVFREPQRAATPGQSVVFYRGNKVIGGGFISE